jgi:hypothetical protein
MSVKVIYNSQTMWVPSITLRKIARKGWSKVPSSRMHFVSGSRQALQEYLNNLG